MKSKDDANIERLKEQLVSLTPENLVNVFLVNALKNKDEQAIQNTLSILFYAYSEDEGWKNEVFHQALIYHNYELAVKLIELEAKPNTYTIMQDSIQFTLEQKKKLIDLLNK